MLRPLRILLAIATAIALQACSGSSSKTDTPADRRTTITSGVLVDPYIEGAVLQELTNPARKLVQQTNAPTGADGVFHFDLPLTKGNIVVLTVTGVSNGVPYTVRLERLVDVTTGSLVVSPLTTLLAAGKTPAQVIASLDPALASSLSAADLTRDPMASGTLDPRATQLLAASIAVGGALQLTGGNALSADLPAATNAIGVKVLDALAQAGGDVAVGASVGAAIATYVAENAATPADAGTVAGTFDATVIGSLVDTRADSGVPVTVSAGIDGVVIGTTAGTLEDYLARGLDALQSGLRTHASDDFLRAARQLSAAASLASTSPSSTKNDLDKARFFGGLARVALLAQPYSDGMSNGLNDFGDLLDAFGLAPSRGDRTTFDPSIISTCQPIYVTDYQGNTYQSGESCQARPIAANSPRTGQLQAFLVDQVGGGLTDAADLLENVTPTFSAQLTDGSRTLDFDYTDALFLKGAARGMTALLQAQAAYNLDVDLHYLQNVSGYSLQRFAADYPGFLHLAAAASLPASKANALMAIQALEQALTSLRAETDDQSDDIIVITNESCVPQPPTGCDVNGNYCSWYPPPICTTTYNPAQNLADAEFVLTTANAVVSATAGYTIDDNGTPGDTSDDGIITPSRFFQGIDLRAKLPTAFNLGPYGDRFGPFQDPTLGGLIAQFPPGKNFNADLDQDGIPDQFGGFTQFGTWVRGETFQEQTWSSPPANITLSASGNTFNAEKGGTYFSGTYSYTARALTLSFSPTSAVAAGFDTMVLEVPADGFWQDGFNGTATYYTGGVGGTVTSGPEDASYSFGSYYPPVVPPAMAKAVARLFR